MHASATGLVAPCVCRLYCSCGAGDDSWHCNHCAQSASAPGPGTLELKYLHAGNGSSGDGAVDASSPLTLEAEDGSATQPPQLPDATSSPNATITVVSSLEVQRRVLITPAASAASSSSSGDVDTVDHLAEVLRSALGASSEQNSAVSRKANVI